MRAVSWPRLALAMSLALADAPDGQVTLRSGVIEPGRAAGDRRAGERATARSAGSSASARRRAGTRRARSRRPAPAWWLRCPARPTWSAFRRGRAAAVRDRRRGLGRAPTSRRTRSPRRSPKWTATKAGDEDVIVLLHLFPDADASAVAAELAASRPARRGREERLPLRPHRAAHVAGGGREPPRRSGRAQRRLLDRAAPPARADQRHVDLGRPVRPVRRRDHAGLRPRDLRRGPGGGGAGHRSRRRHVLLPRRRLRPAADQHRRRHDGRSRTSAR